MTPVEFTAQVPALSLHPVLPVSGRVLIACQDRQPLERIDVQPHPGVGLPLPQNLTPALVVPGNPQKQTVRVRRNHADLGVGQSFDEIDQHRLTGECDGQKRPRVVQA